MEDKGVVRLIYDHECPFCDKFASYIALHKKYNVELIDARSHHNIVAELAANGYDINQGMIIQSPYGIYIGKQAVEHLDLLMQPDTRIARCMLFVSHHHRFVQFLYPLIYGARKITLGILGKKIHIDVSAEKRS